MCCCNNIDKLLREIAEDANKRLIGFRQWDANIKAFWKSPMGLKWKEEK